MRARRYIQFNDFVFNDYDLLKEFDGVSASWKYNTHEYSGGHGSYAPLKGSYLREQTLSMKLYLRFKKLPCEKREFYRDFVIEQLNTPGKLWAVQDGGLVWAYAYVSSYDESSIAYLNMLEIDLDFVLYEGVFHKADPRKTFLQPYDICSFLDCFGYKHQDPCPPLDENACCDCNRQQTGDVTIEGCCCNCDTVTKEMALCYNTEELDKFEGICGGAGYRVIYNCAKGHEFFGDGVKMCTADSCSSIIAGILYSNTSIPTDDVTIVIAGGLMHNPSIEINGNVNVIEGTYDGKLIIKPNGDVYLERSCCTELLDPSVWVVPKGNTYGWKIKPRNNRVIIDLGACCGMTCAYFDVGAITI